MTKSTEYYLALAAGVLFVILQHKEKPWGIRVGIAGVSGLMGYSLAPDVAAFFARSEALAVTLIAAFSYAVLDTIGALLADRETIKQIIRRRMGGGSK